MAFYYAYLSLAPTLFHCRPLFSFAKFSGVEIRLPILTLQRAICQVIRDQNTKSIEQFYSV